MSEMEDRLVIDVARMNREGEELSGALSEAALDLHDPYVKPFAGLRYELGAMLFGRELLVRGRLEQDFEGVCSRCGKDFDFTVKVPDFTASFEVDEKSQFLDLTEELRESILLALPNYPVCREDCPGIETGGAVPPDSRWNELDKLEKGKGHGVTKT